MAEPGMGHRNQTELFFRSKVGSVFALPNTLNPSRRGKETPTRFATSNSRLGDAALVVRRAIGQGQLVPAACRVFGASPYQRFEDEDDDEDEYDFRATRIFLAARF